MAKVFFDHISTTPLDPRVLEAMMPYLTEWYGNPSSHIHEQGQGRHSYAEGRESTMNEM